MLVVGDIALDQLAVAGVGPEVLRAPAGVLADDLVGAFTAAKAIYLKDLQGSTSISSWDKAAADNAAVVGDPFPFGIEKNRKALETMTKFAVDQHMVPRRYSVEELFAVK